MSTRSNIAVRKSDGTIKVIYCHFDGYVEGVGQTLLEHYNEWSKADELTGLGDISALEPTIKETEARSYKKRGEKDVDARYYKNYDEYREDADTIWIEYIYIFDEIENAWFMAFPEFVKLEDIVKAEEVRKCWQ